MTRSNNAAGSAWFDLRRPSGGSTSDESDPTARFRLAARGRTPIPIRAKPIGTGDQPRWFCWETAQPEDSFPSREFPLGYFKSQNASYGHEVSGTYFITPGNFRSGTMNAPVLYAVSTVHHTNGEAEVIQRNLYEPHENACANVQSGDCDAPIETQWQSSLRAHRHWLESILLSGDEPETISPWVTLPTQALFGHTLTEDDLSLQLCMLRAKNIPELLVWNDHTTGDTEQEWPAFQRVYTPILDDTNLAEGAIVSGSGLYVERVRRTLFDGNDLPYVIAMDRTAQSIATRRFTA